MTAGTYRKLHVRVSTLDGDVTAWVYVFDGYEGGLPTSWYLSEIANAAEKAGAPGRLRHRAAVPPHRHRVGVARSPTRPVCAGPTRRGRRPRPGVAITQSGRGRSGSYMSVQCVDQPHRAVEPATGAVGLARSTPSPAARPPLRRVDAAKARRSSAAPDPRAGGTRAAPPASAPSPRPGRAPGRRIAARRPAPRRPRPGTTRPRTLPSGRRSAPATARSRRGS